jgi:uncharacterized membrane protein
MWFVGLLAGMILGGLIGSAGGAIVGGILGLAGGLIYGELSRGRNRPLEERVEALEQKVKQLSAQIVALNAGQHPAGQTQPAIVAPAANISVNAPEISPANEFPETFEDPEFSRAIKPAFAQTRDQDYWQEIPSEALQQDQRNPEAAPARSILEEHEWLANLFKGNILAKVGVIILFFGIASGLKLAVDMGLFPISVRLMLGAFAAIALSVFGYHRAQRPEHRMFGLAMQGGGLGVLYLLVYFMLGRYQIIGETLAFVLFTLIGVSCVLLAARQDGRSLAMLGISGAFLSPVMVANSGGSQITLFSYFLLLNTFIISVNWFKGWRELNMSGFIFTLVIGMNWAFRSYVPSDFPVSETFLILFFLLYSATPVLFNLFNAPGRLSWGDGMLLYGTPLAAAALQNHLLQGQDITLAWNACAAGAYYLVLWWAIHRRPDEETVWLEKSLLGIAIGFFTIAIPLAFNAQLTAAFWTLEGFGVLYLGVKQNRFLARLSGSALQVLAGIYFYAHSHELQRAFPVLNDWYVGCLIVVVASFASALLLQRTMNAPTGTEKKIVSAVQLDTSDFAVPFLYWGMLWWFGAGFAEIDRFTSPAYQTAMGLGLCLLSFMFLEWLGTRKDWHAMRQPSLLLLFAILYAAYDTWLKQGHALSGIMSLLMPLALLAQYWLLYRHDRDSVPSASQLRHAIGYWLLIVLVGSEFTWSAEQLAIDHSLWPWLAWGMAGALGILASLYGLKQARWPFAPHGTLYRYTLQTPVALLLSLWVIYGNLTHSGGGSGLPYLPLLNPFDLMQLLAMYAIWKWLRATASPLQPALYGIAFLWISAEAARLTHHWGGVPFESHSLLASSMLQAGLSMLWTAIAMSVMVYASYSKQRALWFNGFGLLAIVGIKLMMIDLSNKGTAVWTLSLIGIALLIIAASYFSPAPPKEEMPSRP